MKAIDFLELVHKELKHLKENATSEEISNLNFNLLDVLCPYSCVYGQMTGRYDSRRAIELKPCECFCFISDTMDTFREWLPKNNEYSSEKENKFSHLECYIALKGAKNEEVIQYLKGEIDEITL